MWTDVRKFGLEYCDLPTMLSNVSAMLRILSLNIDGRNNERIPIPNIVITAMFTIVYSYAYIFSGYWFIFLRDRDLTSSPDLFIAVSLCVTGVTSIVKLYYMMFYRDQIRALMNKYLAFDASIPKGSRYSSNMLKSLRYVKRRGIVYWLVLMVDSVLFFMRPLVTPGRHLALDSYVYYGLEPMLESPNYEIATSICAILVLFVCYSVANVTCFLTLILGYSEAQMLSLGIEMTHLWDDALDEYMKKENNEFGTNTDTRNKTEPTESEILNSFVKEHLVNIINRHATTRNLLSEIEDILKGLNAIVFLLLITGLIGELLGGIENTVIQIPFTMLQLGIDCYLSQKLIDSNEAFERAVYACNWEMFNKSNRKIVLLILQNSQKTMALSAGGMATLSFTCFMSIIKSAYSAYTTLRSMV